MKRYSTTSIRAYEPAEDPNGQWVRYEDVHPIIEALGEIVADPVISEPLRMKRGVADILAIAREGWEKGMGNDA